MAQPISESTNQADVAKSVLSRFDASWQYAKPHHKRFERNYKLYNNRRTDVSYKGVANSFVPMVFSTVETLTAALAAGRPSIDFVPQDMYSYIWSYATTSKKPNLKALNSQFDYFWDCDNWDLKSIKTIRSGFIYGISGEWVYWDGDKPRILNLNPRDMIIDPNLTDPMDLITNPDDYYSGRRFITTLDALKAERIVDPDSGKLVARYKNLNHVTPGTTGGEKTDKENKEMFLGAIGDSTNLVEVIEIWDGKRIRSLANRNESYPIEDRPNTLGIHCLVIHRFIADESVIWGKAIVDPIALPQELLNDVTNQSVDAVTDILAPQYELDPTYSDFIGLVTNAPNTVYPFAPGALRRIDKGVVPASAFNERQNLKNEIRETTAADQVVKGVAADGGKATATEINAQLNQAGQRFELYVRMLEREGFYQRAKIVYRMMLHYMRGTQLVPTNSIDGPKFHQFDPSQFDETYEPKIQLEASVRNAKAKDQSRSAEIYTQLIADPTNNLWEAKKILYPKMFDLSEEELDRIIGQQAPEPGMGMEGAPMPGESPVVDPVAEQAQMQEPLL